jgi:hypothetical protein
MTKMQPWNMLAIAPCPLFTRPTPAIRQATRSPATLKKKILCGNALLNQGPPLKHSEPQIWNEPLLKSAIATPTNACRDPELHRWRNKPKGSEWEREREKKNFGRVDKDILFVHLQPNKKNILINYQLVIRYRLLIVILTNQPTVDKTGTSSYQPESMVDKIWKLTNVVRDQGLDSLLGFHTHRDNPISRIICVPIPPLSRCVTPWKILLLFP